MLVSASLWAASQALRIASLNLCSDEYLLLLAGPGQIASLSRLASDPQDSVLWRRAKLHPANRGSLESALSSRPTLVLTMGGGGKASSDIAQRLGLQVVDLPSPQNPEDVARNMVTVAKLLGDPARASPWLRRFARLQAPHRQLRDTILLTQGGYSTGAGSLGAKWMIMGGMRQRHLPGGRATLETLALHPPDILLRSNYRRGEASLGQIWLNHPLARAGRARSVETDGRPWTCAGPLMLDEIGRLGEKL